LGSSVRFVTRSGGSDSQDRRVLAPSELRGGSRVEAVDGWGACLHAQDAQVVRLPHSIRHAARWQAVDPQYGPSLACSVGPSSPRHRSDRVRVRRSRPQRLNHVWYRVAGCCGQTQRVHESDVAVDSKCDRRMGGVALDSMAGTRCTEARSMGGCHAAAIVPCHPGWYQVMDPPEGEGHAADVAGRHVHHLALVAMHPTHITWCTPLRLLRS